nr:uncharacterized protein LOC124815575 [Hydra vulgaris]
MCSENWLSSSYVSGSQSYPVFNCMDDIWKNELTNRWWVLSASAVPTFALFILIFSFIIYSHYKNEQLIAKYRILKGTDARAPNLISIREYNCIVEIMKKSQKRNKKFINFNINNLQSGTEAFNLKTNQILVEPKLSKTPSDPANVSLAKLQTAFSL